MKNKEKLLAVVLFVLLALTACNTPGGTSGDTQGGDVAAPVLTDEEITARDCEMFTARDYEVGYDETAAVKIELKGDSAESSSDLVRINGSVVTLTKEATYIFSGTLTNGKIIVNAADTDKLQIVLNSVSITHSTSAAIYIVEADKVFVTLASGTENVIANGGTFVGIGASKKNKVLASEVQGIVTWNGAEQQAGATVKIGEKKNDSIVNATAGFAFTNVTVSSSDIAKGASYNAVIGSVVEKLTAN